MRFEFKYPGVIKFTLEGKEYKGSIPHFEGTGLFVKCTGYADVKDNKSKSIAYIFGRQSVSSVIKSIVHETLHIVIDRIEGYDTSLFMDELPRNILKDLEGKNY